MVPSRSQSDQTTNDLNTGLIQAGLWSYQAALAQLTKRHWRSIVPLETIKIHVHVAHYDELFEFRINYIQAGIQANKPLSSTH